DYGRITPLIVKAVQDIANLADTFKHTLIAWLGNTSNGIGKLFAREICLTDDSGTTCYTRSQLNAVLAGAASTASGASAPITISATIAPILELNGNASSTIQVGDTYNDLGARIVAPESDVNLGIVILLDGATTTAVSIDTSALGEHTILYTVTSPTTGLTGHAMRTVIVSPAVQLPEPPVNDNPFNAAPENDNAAVQDQIAL
ncbi:DUF5011 domain-containing protein, partial [Candidatus Kaiserbacteria bacterium]|nr:DUF5011 domain-containing protein [Candidatus Kaiserbacteria bacterium]